MMGRLRPLLLLALACGACAPPPAGQVRLFVTTDAPLPGGAASLDVATEAPPLFDRLRVDLYRPGEDAPCAGCTSQFAADRALVDAGGASVGLVPPVGASGYRARVRLFLGASSLGPEPDPDVTIDSTIALPTIAEDGIVDVTVLLSTDDVGVRRGWPEPLDPTPGAAPAGLVGSWPHARRVDCAEPPGPGEVCVPGGAYWMGNPRAGIAHDPGTESDRQRLVVLSPFYLDATELTVGDVRAFPALAHTLPTHEQDPICNYTAVKGDHEDHPLNCASPAFLQNVCKQRGGNLPTEAQLEYVGGGLRSLLHVWGEDEPTCEDAVYGYGDCPGRAAHDQPGGSGRRDRLELPTGTIVDIAGNLSEYVLDRWNRQDEACWSRPGVYVDPVCDTPSIDDGMPLMLIRCFGASWADGPLYLRAAVRHYGCTSSEVYSGGRCARPARPR
jgi:formylglycine-generating enzyme required for sulfatase activity